MTSKPSTASIDFGHPLAHGLICCLLINERGGPLVDLVTGNSVPLIGSGAHGIFNFGPGLNCNAAGSGAAATAWSLLKSISTECTILFRGTIASGAATFPTLFGVAYSEPYGAPFTCYAFDLDSAGAGLRLAWSNGASQVTLSGTPTAYDGTERQYVGVIRTGGSGGYAAIFENHKRLNDTGTVTFAPIYSATSELTVGYRPLINSKSVFRHAYIWNRELKHPEIQRLYAEPYAFIRQPARRHFAALAPTISIPALQANYRRRRAA